ncbi:MAG: hypothetical protein ACYCUM_13465 [Solirubrobacteraceae bacterium]
MARTLIIGGGERGVALARARIAAGDVVRIVVADAGAAAVEAAGAEPWIGDPLRLGTVLGALDGVTVGCWLFADADRPRSEREALHGARLESFLAEAVDTTLRGFLYEAAGEAEPELLRAGAGRAARIARQNAIPLASIDVPPDPLERWLRAATHAISMLLGSSDALDSDAEIAQR